MRTLFKILFAAIMCLNALYAESLVEGKDYMILEQPLNVPKNSVVEIFNIGCPHCANMNRILPNLFAILPQDVVFLPYHIITAFPFSSQASEVLAVSLKLDSKQNLSPKDSKSSFNRAVNAFFNANFKERKFFKSKEEFVNYGLVAIECAKEDFTKNLETKEVKETLQIWQEASKSAQIQGVPTFIINGKYLILSENLKSEEDLAYKIDILLGR